MKNRWKVPWQWKAPWHPSDDLAECADCDRQWVGADSWESAMRHMHTAQHHVRMTGAI